MNILLICNKKSRKNYENILAGIVGHSHIGTETIVRDNIVNVITENHAPHTVVWANGVPFKKTDLDFLDVVYDIRTVRPDLRFIYVNDGTEQGFEGISRSLQANNVFDILTDFEQITDIIDEPMTIADVLTEKEKSGMILNKVDPKTDTTHELDELPQIMHEQEIEVEVDEIKIETEIKAETKPDIYPVGFVSNFDCKFDFDRITAITY